MKECSKCKELKSEDSFYKDKRTKDGLYSCCKKCHYVKRFSLNKRHYDGSFCLKEYQNEYQKSYCKRTGKNERYKRNCRKKTNKLLVRGKINKQPCNICGDIKSQAHHTNYDNPYNIIWLCKKHHVELHQKLKKPI